MFSNNLSFKINLLEVKKVDLFWDVFKELLQTSFPGYTQEVVNFFLQDIYSKNSFINWVLSKWKIVFIAEQKENVIGFAVLDKPYGGVCFLRWLGVLKDFRHQGIGRQLIRRWLDFSRQYGCHKAELAAQIEAKIFYEDCGLKLEGKREKSYFGIDQYVFGKVLAEPKVEVMTKK